MKKVNRNMLILLFAVLFTVSVYHVFKYYRQSEAQKNMYNNLVEIVQSKEQDNIVDEPKTQVQYSDKKEMLPELAELYSLNSDLVGWIKIEDTNINYPVMQSVNEPNFYLKHGFDKSYTEYGCPYVQENCNLQIPSDNIVIYGHHMKNGTMFADLEKYKSQDFWKEHKTVLFNTLTDKQEYEIVAVFKSVVSNDDSDTFKYYQFVDAENYEEFYDFISMCKELSLYDTGVVAEYGEKLITLSTCEYSQANGRLVVVAKQILPV